jgi:hypothetical protein
MNYNPLVATVMHGHDADAQLAGLAGLLFGAFLRAPGQADPEQLRRPTDSRGPVDLPHQRTG